MTPPRGAVGLSLPVLAFVVLFALLPVAVLFATSLADSGGLAGAGALLADPLNRAAVGNSLEQGALSAALAVALGYPAGLFVGRFDFPGRGLLRSVLLVPFLLPSLIVVLGVEDLFSSGGLFASTSAGAGVLGSGVPAIVLVNLVFNLPLVVLLTATGCEVASRDLEESVATLGGSPARAYLDGWGRPTWVGAAAGGLLTFLFSALSFAPPLLLCGARCYTVEARIWSLDTVLLQPAAAGVLALAMLLLFLLPTLGYLWLARGLRADPGRRRRPTRRVSVHRPVDLALAAETLAVLGGVAAVLAAVLFRTLAPSGSEGAGAAWASLFSPATTARLGLSVPAAVGNTLVFAVAAAGIAVLLTVPAAFATLGRRSRTSLGLVLFLPLLVSPVVLAFALATFWRPILGGEGSVWVLVIVSQAMLALPFALQALATPLSGLPAASREAAQTLGASRFSAFLDADLPRARDGLVTAALLAFALGLGEFTATFFLVTPRFTTLPVALYGLANARQTPVADAAAGLLLLIALAVFVALSAGGRRVEL